MFASGEVDFEQVGCLARALRVAFSTRLPSEPAHRLEAGIARRLKPEPAGGARL